MLFRSLGNEIDIERAKAALARAEAEIDAKDQLAAARAQTRIAAAGR